MSKTAKMQMKIAELLQANEAAMTLIEQLTAERDALAATVEALQQSLLKCAELVNFDGGTAIDWLIDNCYDLRRQAKATPQQHLRDVRAEAVTECRLIVARATTTYRENPGMGFSSAIEDKTAKQLKWEIAKELEQYAERVKYGE